MSYAVLSIKKTAIRSINNAHKSVYVHNNGFKVRDVLILDYGITTMYYIFHIFSLFQ